MNILVKLAHFFHSTKFWVRLIFPGFSRCFLYRGLDIKRYLCRKSYKNERNGVQPQNIWAFILQIGGNFLRNVRKVLRNSRFWLILWSMWSLILPGFPGFQFFGEKLIYSPTPGGSNPARIFTVAPVFYLAWLVQLLNWSNDVLEFDLLFF